MVAFGAGSNFDNLGTVVDDAFSQEKSRGKFAVMPRSAHGDSDAAAANSNFQRFFASEDVEVFLRFAMGLQTEDTGGNGGIARAFSLRFVEVATFC